MPHSQNVTSASITRKPVLTDKPLPAPPIAHVATVSPSKQSRSLIDASEKPLRRFSPGKPHQKEDWPVLFPEKPTKPGTLQQMARQEGPYSSVRAMRIAYHQERSSAQANAESKSPSIQRKAVTNDLQSSSNRSIDRKPVHESGMRNLQTTSRNKTAVAPDGLFRTVREIRSEQDLRSSTSKEHIPRAETPSSHTLVQNSVDRLQDLSYSRPTKLSSLRARTPTGRPSMEMSSSSNKVVDSKDPHTPNGNSATTAVKGSGSKGDSIGASRLPLAEHRVNNTGSSSRKPGDRAPSKLTIRTRYPEVPTRSSSSSPSPLLRSQPPNKPLPPVPTSQGPRQAGSRANENASKAPTPGLRKSSIPVPRRHGAGPLLDLNSGMEILAKNVDKPSKGLHKQGTSLQALEDAATAVLTAAFKDIEGVDALETDGRSTSSDHIGNTLSPQATQSKHLSTHGKAITEAPEYGTRIKRLSRLSPDHGPVLKISPSADMIIMGKDSGKEETIAAHTKKDKDLHRTVVSKELRKASFGNVSRSTTLKQISRARPSSAGGGIQQVSREIPADPKARERKAMSVDGTYSSQASSHLQELTTRPSLKADTFKHTSNAIDHPFFNPRSELQTSAATDHKESQSEVVTEPGNTLVEADSVRNPNDTKPEPDDTVESEDIQIFIESGANSDNTETCNVHEGRIEGQADVNDVVASMGAADDEIGSSPKHDRQGNARVSNGVPNTPALPPVAVQGYQFGAHDDSDTEHVVRAVVPVCDTSRHKLSSPTDIGDGNGTPTDQMVSIGEVLTPPHQSGSTTGTVLRHSSNLALNEFPPRSSSRAYVQDFTTERYKTCPTPTKYVDARLSKDFQPIQEKLGSSKGVPSIRYDPEAPRSRRSSITRESNKAQGSISKGMLSNFRGLFQKRSSDASDQPSTRSTKRGRRAAITTPGSPYPPISEVHPIHRPIRHRKTGSSTRPTTPEPLWGVSSRADTLVSHSPNPSDTSITNSLTVELINSAKRAPPGPRQDRLWELSSIMVQAVTNAREAEKAKEEAKQAMEEAKHAARKAEMSCILTHKRAAELARFVQEHRKVLE